MSNTPKRPRDPSQLAKLMVGIAAREVEDRPKEASKDNPMASLGRTGGLKNGRARAAKLTDEHHAEIAKIAAAKRGPHEKKAA